MILAPSTVRFPVGSFLVGNQGDGIINVFSDNGKCIGPVLNQRWLPLIINGLMAIAASKEKIFFTTFHNEKSVVGTITNEVIEYSE